MEDEENDIVPDDRMSEEIQKILNDNEEENKSEEEFFNNLGS